MATLLPWLGITLVATVQLLDQPTVPGPGPGAAVANLDALILPFATFLITAASTARYGWSRVLTTIATCAVTVLALNAMLQLAQVAAVAPDLAAWRVTTDTALGTTAERAATLGRFTGIFGQPALAGVVYSVGLLLAVYVARGRPVVQFALVALMATGGIVAASKAFLLVGLPVGAWCYLRTTSGASHRAALAAVGATAVWLVGSSTFFTQWAGAERVIAALTETTDVAAATGNRYGEDSTTKVVSSLVLDHQPLVGFGAQGVSTATDAGWLHILTVSGVIGVALMVVMLLALWVAWLQARTTAPAPVTTLFGGLLVVLTASNLAFPVFIGNRLSVIVWALLAVLCAIAADATGKTRTT
ncbi:hypothetical protein ACH0CA_01500 [Kytococcus sedentarius]|uniref:hypothetical protein n=1 Tax=Kytococcus sedentarius TaxID=1276 RepID=UPI0038795A28